MKIARTFSSLVILMRVNSVCTNLLFAEKTDYPRILTLCVLTLLQKEEADYPHV